MSDVAARQCYICLDTNPQDDDSQWVSPCRCSGTLAWVHNACVLRWIEEYYSHNTNYVACPQCLTRFVLTPDKGPVVVAIETFTRNIYPLFELGACFVITNVAYFTVLTTLGIYSLAQVYSVELLMSILLDMGPVEGAVLIHPTSYCILAINFFSWEDYLLAALRKASRLPVLGSVLPSEAPPQYYDELDIEPLNLSRISTGCITLPIVANVVGNIFFKSETCNLRRAMIGGAAFLAVKCALDMYYKQKLLIRWKGMQQILQQARFS